MMEICHPANHGTIYTYICLRRGAKSAKRRAVTLVGLVYVS